MYLWQWELINAKVLLNSPYRARRDSKSWFSQRGYQQLSNCERFSKVWLFQLTKSTLFTPNRKRNTAPLSADYERRRQLICFVFALGRSALPFHVCCQKSRLVKVKELLRLISWFLFERHKHTHTETYFIARVCINSVLGAWFVYNNHCWPLKPLSDARRDIETDRPNEWKRAQRGLDSGWDDESVHSPSLPWIESVADFWVHFSKFLLALEWSDRTFAFCLHVKTLNHSDFFEILRILMQIFIHSNSVKAKKNFNGIMIVYTKIFELNSDHLIPQMGPLQLLKRQNVRRAAVNK